MVETGAEIRCTQLLGTRTEYFLYGTVLLITLQGQDDKRVIFRRERKVIPNCVISVMIVRKIMKKRSI